jgi:hypothetical protein
MAVRPRRNGEEHCGWLIGTLTVFEAGSWKSNIFSVSTALIFASWTRRSLSRVGPWGSRTIFGTGRTARLGGRRSLSAGTRRPWPCASFGSAAPEGHWHTPSVGDQTSDSRGGLSVAHTTTDRVGPDRVSKRGVPRPIGGWSHCEENGLEFWYDHSQGLAPAWLRQQKLLVVLRAGLPQPQLPEHNVTTDVLGYCHWLRPTDASVYLFCTPLKSPAYRDWIHMPIILSKSTGLPRFSANGLWYFPGLPWRQNPGESRR